MRKTANIEVKRIILCVFAVVFIIMLAACSSGGETTEQILSGSYIPKDGIFNLIDGSPVMSIDFKGAVFTLNDGEWSGEYTINDGILRFDNYTVEFYKYEASVFLNGVEFIKGTINSDDKNDVQATDFLESVVGRDIVIPGKNVKIYGDYIYFIHINDRESERGGKLYRMKTDGSERQTLIEDSDIEYFDMADDWIYYGGLSAVKIDGSEQKKVSDGLYANAYKVYGDRIYYINPNDGNTLYSMTTDGTGIQKITNDSVGHQFFVDSETAKMNFQISDGKIYYHVITDERQQIYALYSVNIDGTERQKLLDHYVRFQVRGDKIYYTYGNSLYVMNTDGSNGKNLHEPVFSFDITEDRIYFGVNYEIYAEGDRLYSDYSAVGLYSMKTDGSDIREIVKSPVNNISGYRDVKVMGNRIYFSFDYYIDDRLYSDGLHSIRTDGSDFRRVQIRGDSHGNIVYWASDGEISEETEITDDLMAVNGKSVIIESENAFVEFKDVIGLGNKVIIISFYNPGNDTDAVLYLNGVMLRVINLPSTGYGGYMTINIDVQELALGSLNTVRLVGTGGQFHVDLISAGYILPRIAEASNFEEKVLTSVALGERELMKTQAYYSLKDIADPNLTEEARAELRANYLFAEYGAFYVFDANASAREISEIAGYIAKTDYSIEDLMRDVDFANTK